MSKYDRVDTTGLVTGRNVMILVPNSEAAKPYDALVSTPFLVYHSGSGENETDLISDALKETLVEALLDAGYICAGINAGSANWGNQTACDAYADLYNTVNAIYNISYVLFLGQSMGGLTGLLCVAQNNIPNVIAWAGIYPACNLSALYGKGTFTSAINNAYACTSDTYANKTYRHDPCLFSSKSYRTIPMRFYASESDSVIVKDDNTDTFQPIISSNRSESTIVLCTGDHGDASHFQPEDLVAFYERAISSPIPTTGNGNKFLIG